MKSPLSINPPIKHKSKTRNHTVPHNQYFENLLKSFSSPTSRKQAAFHLQAQTVFISPMQNPVNVLKHPTIKKKSQMGTGLSDIVQAVHMCDFCFWGFGARCLGVMGLIRCLFGGRGN